MDRLDHTFQATDYVDVVETDELRCLLQGIRSEKDTSGISKTICEWDSVDADAITNFVAENVERWQKVSAIVFSCNPTNPEINLDEGIILPARVVSTSAGKLWSLSGDDLGIVTLDRLKGAAVEKNYYTSSGDYRRDGCVQAVAWTS